MKSIVFVVTNDLTYDRRMSRICTSLREAGYIVEIIGRERRNSILLEHKLFGQRRLRCILNKGPLFYAEYNIRIFFALLRHRADVFGACDLDTAPGVLLAAMLKRRKRIFDAHEHFAEVPEVERRRFVKLVWHVIGRWCVPHFHACYTVGNSLAAVLQDAYKAPFTVIRNVPVFKNASIVPSEQREKLIVYQGALNEGRGLEHAISAMSRLRDFRLCLIGEGDLSQQLREQVEELKLTTRVEFLGYVMPADLNALTAKAMIGLNLLESRSKSYYYSLANKFFDYMHAGVPSLNMCFPEYNSILSAHPVGICIDTLSPDVIADAILRLTKDEKTISEMIEICTTARTEYTWQEEKQKLLDLFQTLGK